MDIKPNRGASPRTGWIYDDIGFETKHIATHDLPRYLVADLGTIDTRLLPGVVVAQPHHLIDAALRRHGQEGPGNRVGRALLVGFDLGSAAPLRIMTVIRWSAPESQLEIEDGRTIVDIGRRSDDRVLAGGVKRKADVNWRAIDREPKIGKHIPRSLDVKNRERVSLVRARRCGRIGGQVDPADLA